MTPDQFITSARKLCEPELCENEYLSEAEVALAQALDMIEVMRKIRDVANASIEATAYLASYDATVKDGGIQANTDRAITKAVHAYEEIEKYGAEIEQIAGRG